MQASKDEEVVDQQQEKEVSSMFVLLAAVEQPQVELGVVAQQFAQY